MPGGQKTNCLFLYPFLFAALVIFSVLVLAINILFHRKR
jgi:hypothetical protein